MSGRKVELDEVFVPTLELEGSTSEKTVLMMMIMKLQIMLLQNLVGQLEYGPHQSGMVILF